MSVVFNYPKKKEKPFIVFDEVQIGEFLITKENIELHLERLFIKINNKELMVIYDSTNLFPVGYVFETTNKNSSRFMVVDVNMEVIVKDF